MRGRSSKTNRKALIVIMMICLLLFFGILLFCLLHLDDWMGIGTDDTEGSALDEKKRFESVNIGGERYWQKSDISTFLLIGVDKDGKMEAVPEGYNAGGQSDFLVLLVFNHTEKTYTAIQINRDTMANVPFIGPDGRVTKRYQQITLAYAYGDGMKKSCVNSANAVSELFYGIALDGYVAVTMDAVGIINDYVGGVTLTMPEDYTNLDPAFEKGSTVHFVGNQALTYVRARMSADDGTNLSRMERQKQYINALIEQAKTQVVDDNFVSTALTKISAYSTSELSMKDIGSFGNYLKEYQYQGLISPKGEARDGENGYVEFYVDETNLKEMAIRYFYEKRD